MPKDEFDFDDPMELNGVGFFTEEDTADAMTECFVEEFMRMGFSPARILGLFHNPYYIGMNMVLLNRGEEFVKNFIARTFSAWGRKVEWTETPSTEQVKPVIEPVSNNNQPVAIDPMGCVVPQEILGGSQ